MSTLFAKAKKWNVREGTPPEGGRTLLDLSIPVGAFVLGVVAGLAAVRAGHRAVECRGKEILPEGFRAEHGDRVLVWVNGIDTSHENFLETLNHLWNFFGLGDDNQTRLCGFHNETIGRKLDTVQAAHQILAARVNGASVISRKVAREFAELLSGMARNGASVVVLGYSQGALISREASLFVPKELRDKIAYVSLGDPHGAHPAAAWGLHLGIFNECDYVERFRTGKSSTTVKYPAPVVDDPRLSHGSKEGYFVSDSEIGEGIRESVEFLFELLRSARETP